MPVSHYLDYCSFISSVAQSCLTLCDPMNCTQHARPPCPSPAPGVHPNPCPLSHWCHPTISSSVIAFSSCPQSFPASGSFSRLQSLSAVILEPPKIKSATVSPSISHEVLGLDAMILVFWMLSFTANFFTLLFHFHQEALQFLFTFCHKGVVICTSEVIDISPSNLDSLCFIHPRISHDVLCIEVK